MEFGTEHIALGPELFVVAVRGDLDLNTSHQLKARLRYVIGEGAKFVCIDLHGHVTVACNSYLCELLRVTGLADLFGLHDSREGGHRVPERLGKRLTPGSSRRP